MNPTDLLFKTKFYKLTFSRGFESVVVNVEMTNNNEVTEAIMLNPIKIPTYKS